MPRGGTAPEEDGALEFELEGEPGGPKRLRVRVPAQRVAGVRARERSKLAGSVRLRGFRPGKVPAREMERRFGEAIDERTVRETLREAYTEVVRRGGLRPVGRPAFEEVEYRKGEDLSFEVEMELVPSPRLERTGHFRVERPGVEVTEEDVDRVLERLREERARWQPVERAPGEGDQVSVRITRLDGEGPAGDPSDGEAPSEPDPDRGERGRTGARASDDGVRGEPYRFVLGEGHAIPDVEEAIAGLTPGREGTFEVRFPDDFDDGELAGSTRRLRISLLEVEEKRLPELDDRLARELGDFDDLQALRGSILEDLRRHREEDAEEAVRRDLLDAIADANPFRIPEALVERQLDRMLEIPEGVPPERVQEARRAFRSRARAEVRRQIVLENLLEQEPIEVSEEDVEGRIEELARRGERSPGEIRRALRRQGRLDELRESLTVEKLFERLKERSEIV